MFFHSYLNKSKWFLDCRLYKIRQLADFAYRLVIVYTLKKINPFTTHPQRPTFFLFGMRLGIWGQMKRMKRYDQEVAIVHTRFIWVL
jgi:hypothetical protein